MSGYIGTQPVPQATQTRDAFTATNNQTSFPTSGYTPEFLDVFLNGVKLAASDYTATNGSDVVLAVGATTGDILEVVSYGTFEVLNPTFDGNVTFTGNASFGDNDKAIFGAGSDLQIYHDGSNSYVSDVGAGQLNILGTNLYLKNGSGSEVYALFQEGANNTYFYYNSSPKLSITSTGIDVTGDTDTSGLFRFGVNNSEIANNYLRFKSGGAAYFDHSTVGQSFNFRVSNSSSLDTNAMTIDSSGRVGIGTSSPQKSLDVEGSIRSKDTNGSSPAEIDITSGGTWRLRSNATSGTNAYGMDIVKGSAGTDVKMSIDSSGKVGIGTSSPANNLHVMGSMTLQGSTGTDNAWTYYKNTDQTYLVGLRGSSNDALSFYDLTADVERMRIDTSGNLLVGTTSTGVASSSSNAGIQLNSSADYIAIARSNGQPLYLNRQSSDGTIIDLRKNGSTVGTIDTHGGVIQFGQGNVNLAFENGADVIYPANDNGTNNNGDIDLGTSGARFKDAYLSGGIHLGGTGSANKLDDYEEGSFTPFMRINSGVQGITYNSRDGYYTKVGNLVTALVVINLSSKGTNVGGVSIDGLPFTAADSMSHTSFNGTCMPAYFSSMATNISTLTGWVAESTTEMYLRHIDGSGNSSIQNTTNSNINNNTDFRFLITYIST